MVWSLINKFDLSDIKSIPYIENSVTIMLTDEASNLNIDDSFINMKLDVETYRTLIPSIDWRNLNDDRHTSKGSIINGEQHEVFLQDLVSDQNHELQDLLENHFGLQDTYKVTMNGYLRWEFRKLYSSPKPVVKMKPNKLLSARIITSIHIWRGRVVKLKSTWYQLDDYILLKRKFDSHLWKQYIQAYAIKYQDFHKTKSSREKYAISLQSMTIEHPSKQGKLNGVGKIFLDLFELSKYPFITTIHFMIDDVEAS